MSTLAYPKWVVNDDHLDATEREFILLSVSWLDDLSRQQHPQRFLGLPNAERQAMLAQISRSDAGENWLSTLLLYIFEALLTDPVNGGNPNGIGRQWLGHRRPGFPGPTNVTRFKAGGAQATG